ncbi:glycosyltransferase family 39 protein [Klenkia sp. PcliD-1-E]|uniref:ArnT family glycosyltransferase n=1 Tax=Klenkia sp. PcliD-1-E TaxID=2954492 RepID=UPI0020973C04|nr:glycosyltransferase family 39 protein [Klenkia sp. PcliD-1-E]MCO7220054.1 glycosyltransferase family 39 protein [Klenkia sp. PcliD-1-E]
MTTAAPPVPAATAAPPAATSTGPAARWFLPALLALLIGSGVLYTVGAARSGWANAYYAAATQAGALDWHAYLFGSLDPSGGITIDKPPAAIWLTALSARVFGLSPDSVLWPQAACAVAAIALLVATVRRHAGDVAGLVAGAVLAVTPVVTLLARYDNPDALMVLLLVAAAYAVTRAVDRAEGGGGWVVAAGALIGLAFLTKLGQALLVVPALAVTVLVAAPGPLRRRLGRLAAGGAAMVVSAGWWVLLVEATPVAERPYIGGSNDNSVVGLALGYDGLARVTGTAGHVGNAHWGRLFGSGGDQAGWLLPAALLLVGVTPVLIRRLPRTDPTRAGLLLWGSWLVVVGLVLSGLRGISHSYYSVQIAPAIAALCAVAGTRLWRLRTQKSWAGPVLATVVGLSAAWATGLLLRGLAWPAAVIPVVLAGAGLGGIHLVRSTSPGSSPLSRTARACMVAGVLVSMLAGPTAWSVATALAVHQGSGPVAGPGTTSFSANPGFRPGSPVPLEVTELVHRDAPGHRWAAAVPGRRAADLQLATGDPVLELRGYTGHDPSPTLEQFQRWVLDGDIRYLVVASGSTPASPGSTLSSIEDWAGRHFPVHHYSGWDVLDLSVSPSGASGNPG